jgi:hypothetical protein
MDKETKDKIEQSEWWALYSGLILLITVISFFFIWYWLYQFYGLFFLVIGWIPAGIIAWIAIQLLTNVEIISVIAVIVVISIIGLFIHQTENQRNVSMTPDQLAAQLGGVPVSQNTQPQTIPFDSNTITLPTNDPDSYQGYITQTGGTWSTNVEYVAYRGLYGTEGQLTPSGNYLDHDFNSARDLMWVSCKDGYEIVHAESPTNNKIIGIVALPDDTHPALNGTVGIEIQNTPKNIIVIQCKKQ